MTDEMDLPEIDKDAAHIDETTAKLYAITVDNRIDADGNEQNVSLYLHYWQSIDDLRARKLSTQKFWMTREDMDNFSVVMQDEVSVVRGRSGEMIPPDSLDAYRPSDDEFDAGNKAAHALVEHCKRCKASAAEKHISEGAGEWVVSVEWKPNKDGKAN